MSRSYRKFPVVKDCCRTSKDRFKPKTYANRAVRRYKEMPTGKSCFFKKIYCSWNISDYRFVGYMNKTEVLREWETYDYIYYDTYKEALWYWKKCYIRK
ncbi:MAG: hypothetical protein NC205_04735 [Prevotella sp.]|nr:hypothetical protein [Alistipes senegalensis]MCM1357879.1 hypothetical protein [Prevotella sp.]MCM1473903.1 hypothetical protein [Muribaculaceae bacterium]